MTTPDWHPVRVNYQIVPSLVGAVFGPAGVAEDDLGNRYEDRGGAFGLDPDRGRTDGVLTMPTACGTRARHTSCVLNTSFSSDYFAVTGALFIRASR